MFAKRSAMIVAAVVLASASATTSRAQLARPTGRLVVFTIPDRAPIDLRRQLGAPAASKQGDRAEAKIPIAVQNKKQALVTRAGPLAQGGQVINCDARTLDIAPEGQATVMGDLVVIDNAKTLCPGVGKTFTPPPGIAR